VHKKIWTKHFQCQFWSDIIWSGGLIDRKKQSEIFFFIYAGSFLPERKRKRNNQIIAGILNPSAGFVLGLIAGPLFCDISTSGEEKRKIHTDHALQGF